MGKIARIKNNKLYLKGVATEVSKKTPELYFNGVNPAITILNKAIEDNRGLIENRVFEMVSNYDFNETKDEIYSVVCNAIEKKLFGE